MAFLTDTNLVPKNNKDILVFGLAIVVVLWALCALFGLCLGKSERMGNTNPRNVLVTNPTVSTEMSCDDRAGHDSCGTERFFGSRNVGPRFNGTNASIQEFYAGDGVATHATGYTGEYMSSGPMSDAELMGKAAGR